MLIFAFYYTEWLKAQPKLFHIKIIDIETACEKKGPDHLISMYLLTYNTFENHFFKYPSKNMFFNRRWSWFNLNNAESMY